MPLVEPLGNGQILLRGRAVVRVASGMKAAVAFVSRRDGGGVDPDLADILGALEAEACTFLSARPRCPHAAPADTAVLRGLVIDPISSEEAAMILGMTERNVRRLAPQLGGRLIRGRWILDRATIVAAADDRAQGRAA